MAEEGTFCINADVEKKAGANCSATSKAEAFTNVYIQEVEGFIMVAMREDFKGDYASLNDESKELLRRATSNLAAMMVIIYDMSGFTTRIEAEDMLNVLYATAKDCLKLLAEQKSVTYAKT
jgi:hypothetical protein